MHSLTIQEMKTMNVHDYASQAPEQSRMMGNSHHSHHGSHSPEKSSSSYLSSRVRGAFHKKSVLYGSVLALLAIVVVVTVSLTATKDNRSSNSLGLTTNGPRYPTPEVPPTVQQNNRNELGTFLIQIYDQLESDWDVLSDEDSPQFKALHWLAGRDEYTSYDRAQQVQRYALACFYYATFFHAHDFLTAPTDWASQEEWITDAQECTWEGIACDSEGRVTGIILPKRALSGHLPIELAMISSLQELDLTSNFVYMEDDLHKLWLHLSNLKHLLMEDNFMVTTSGLPEEFTGLVSLEKLQLSYNLLQGELQGAVFTAMPNLHHLEIESNYLSGSLPTELGALENLVYIYARRNLFTFRLDQMIVSGAYPVLFSLWLDNNQISGTIPAAIGGLSGLASFSVTNATLTGPIPDEFGNIQTLKRVWLYDNQLNGQLPTSLNNLVNLEVFEIHDNDLAGVMPSNICNAVAGSSYEFATLTADCDRVTCDNCCTVCYSG